MTEPWNPTEPQRRQFREAQAAAKVKVGKPKADRPPTAVAVSALLRAAGFERAESSPSRIRGLRNWSDGYQVSALSGQVKVRHMTFSRTSIEDDRKRQMLARYADAIRAARPAWAVTGPEPDGWLELTVAEVPR